MTDVLEQPGRTRKPKTMQQGHDSDFQTDPFVLGALYPYLRREWIVWESAAGEGQLSRALAERGHWVIGSDIRTGQDFFTTNPPEWDVQITNPPYQVKDAWLARSYELGKPFALLLPLTTFEGAEAPGVVPAARRGGDLPPEAAHVHDAGRQGRRELVRVLLVLPWIERGAGAHVLGRRCGMSGIADVSFFAERPLWLMVPLSTPYAGHEIDHRTRAEELRPMPTDAEVELESEYIGWRIASGFEPTREQEKTLWEWEQMAADHFGGGML